MTATVKPPTFLQSYHDEESVRRIEYRQIGQTDMVVSPLSFGASSLGGVFRQTDDAESGERERRGERYERENIERGERRETRER